MAADSNQPPPPPDSTSPSEKGARSTHHQFFEHLDELVDACSGRPVTEDTELVQLVEAPEMFIRNLVGIAGPAVPCQIKLEDGHLAPDVKHHASSHPLQFTYNKLLLAPRVRISYDLCTRSGRKYDTLVIECPFNDYGKDGRGIYDYRHAPSGLMSFVVFGSTCSGFNKLDLAQHLPGTQDRQIIDTLRSLIAPDHPVQVTLQLHDSMLPLYELPLIRRTRAHLPGGTKALLPSIAAGVDYEAFDIYEDKLQIQVPERKSKGQIPHRMRLPKRLISGRNKEMELLRKTEDTFVHALEAVVELVFSQIPTEAISRLSLRFWSRPSHWARLIDCGDYAVIAVSNFSKHSTINGVGALKLPRELECVMKFTRGRLYEDVVGRLLDHHPALPNHAALFRVLSHSVKDFGGRAQKPGDDAAPQFPVSFDPHYNSFIFTGQLRTGRQLQDDVRWHPVLLNQRHSEVPFINTIAASPLSPSDQERLFYNLRACKPWNHEQLDVIDSLKHLKGGLSVVMGPAGTGKTMLNRALSLYYWCMGFHILSISPANSNCNSIASTLTPEELLAEFPGMPLSTFEFLRLFPSSRDIGVEKLTERQAKKTQAGHDNGEVASFREFLTALDEREKTRDTIKQYSVLQTMISVAEDKSLTKMAQLGNDKTSSEIWDCLRELIRRYREHTFDYDDVMAYKRNPGSSRWSAEIVNTWKRYADAYDACKAHIISQNRYMISTSGNVHSRELIENWYDIADDGTPRVGVVIFMDESPKDVEINTWAPIVCTRWAHAVSGVFLFGDDKQLGPTNTSCDKVNPYHKRLDVALACRLIREGFPVYRLREQYRMNACLADFPAREIYDGNMRSADCMYNTLESVKPGIGKVLHGILSQQGRFELKPKDADLRLQWVTVSGEIQHEQNSVAVPEHIDTFFEKMYHPLQAYFSSRGEKFSEQVMIICSYRHAKRLYREAMNDLLKKDRSLTADDMPRLETVDGSQGLQSFMVILDGTFQSGDKLGFMTDPTRVNVAITRATDVFWIMGGLMRCKYSDSKKHLINRYRSEMGLKGRIHDVGYVDLRSMRKVLKF